MIDSCRPILDNLSDYQICVNNNGRYLSRSDQIICDFTAMYKIV